jgi:hypothetical protein
MATSAAQEARMELAISAPREEETLQKLDLGKPWGHISWNLNRKIC